MYSAVMPDRLGGREIAFPAVAATAISRAEAAVARLQRRRAESGGLGFSEVLLRIEAVSSVRLTNAVLKYERVASALVGEGKLDHSVELALAVQEVLRQAIGLDPEVDWSQPSCLTELAQTLEPGRSDTRGYRRHQIWTGGTPTPRHAEYIPPPPDLIPDLVEDLCAFLQDGDVPPVAAAAIGLGQFEAIQPFARANEVQARCLPAFVLRNRGLIDRLFPPVSAVLASDPRGYAAGLAAFRAGEVAAWCRLYARAVEIACVRAIQLCDDLTRLQRTWISALGKVRADSAAMKLIPRLLDTPTLSVTAAQKLINVSDEAARVAMLRLDRAGVLKELTGMEYRRVWSAKEVFTAMENFHYEVDAAGWPEA